MKIIVCPLHDVEALIRLRQPSHIISLLSPSAQSPCFDEHTGERLELHFNDISTPMPGLVEPSEEHVLEILDFASKATADDTIIVHCWAGVSRSTAAAYIIRCAQTHDGQEVTLANQLRAQAPYATPNPAIVTIADRVLKREGAMSRAIQHIGRGAETAWGSPFSY